MDTGTVHIIRHGESAHNVDPAYPHRDPPLSAYGDETTKQIKLPVVPDLIVISPMTRALQTAINVFPNLLTKAPFPVDVRIWPELRAPRDADCNRGSPRSHLEATFPGFDFSDCLENWDYPPHTASYTAARAETVRARLKGLAKEYHNIVVVTHRGFISYISQDKPFDFDQVSSYRFAKDDGDDPATPRFAINQDTGVLQDFGPSILLPVKKVV